MSLRSENMTKKVNYDQFCEKLATFIMNVFKNGDCVVEVSRNPSANIIENFKKLSKPEELTDEEKASHIETEIKKEEIKDVEITQELIARFEALPKLGLFKVILYDSNIMWSLQILE